MEYFVVFSTDIHRKECSLMEAIFNILTVLVFFDNIYHTICTNYTSFHSKEEELEKA